MKLSEPLNPEVLKSKFCWQQDIFDMGLAEDLGFA